MKEFLLNNIVAIITLIATILIPLVVYILQKSKKELSYKIISENKIFNTEIDKRLKVSFNNTVIEEELTLILLKVINTGNQPITKKDFEENSGIDILFGKDILSVETQKTKPSNLHIDANEILPGYFEIQPLLLNPKDEFTLKLLVEKHNTSDFKVGARISGISEIKPLKEKLMSYNKVVIYSIVASLLSILSLFNNFSSSPFGTGLLLGILTVIISDIITSLIKYKFKKSS
ncbi:hypothetical protein V7295_29510 [Bacillus toyonensis]|uniref:hypothetical protein n=1 Tax=Bacillus toyonensis TaxID=155322 RepID=UPI000BFC58F1|nr:hypothetical protein [Bacillus toyonensis]PHF69463.1 hypothetical protein COI52_20385 [Bacillus toyonensis]